MKIEINSISLNYSKVGQGQPLILLHGNGEDLHIFDALVDKLKDNFSVYSVDSRNHGESTITDDFSYTTMVEDIIVFIEKLNLDPVSIVGFSDGGIIALMLAIREPKLLDKIAILGVNLKPSDFKKEIYDELVDAYKQTNDPLLKLMLEQPNIELEELRAVKTETLVVAGDDDLFDLDLFQKIKDTLPNAKLKIMENHTHDSYVVNSDILYPILNSFLD